MKLYARYKTNLKDNLKFKLISGDKNSLHYDLKYLKNTPFSYPLTQGQLLVTLSLLKLKKLKIIDDLSLINTLDAKFLRPSIIGEDLSFNYFRKKNKIKIKISNYFEDKILLILTLDKFPKKTPSKLKEYKFLNLIAKLNKKEELILKNNIEISKIVGNYKSKINLLINFTMHLKKGNNRKSFSTRFNSNFVNLMKLNSNFEFNVNFLSFNKKLNFNHKFQIDKLLKKKLSDKKILILGGTSDLGNIIMGYLKKNKIKFDFTYFKNKKKAQEIYKKFSNIKNDFFQFDIKKKLKKNSIQKIENYDVILFLMTKKVFREKYKHFNINFFNELNNYNISILSKIIDHLIQRQKKYFIIIPSTKIIDLNYNQNLEYSLSKMIMEKYSKSISQNYKLINIFTPRLEAFKTRQSQFMLGVNNNTNDLIQKLFYKI